MGIVRAYKRWRHGRGFGVHSPYAFRMINDVLRLPGGYGFYEYAEIARVRSRLRAPVALGEAWLVFRLVVEFGPRRVHIAARGPLERMLRAVVRLAVPGAELTERLGDIAAGDLVIAFDDLGEGIPEGAHAYLTCGAMGAVPAAMGRGHVYRNGRRAVIAARGHLPFEVFEVGF